MVTDVLIAGAGPVGLTMAIELKRYGVSVRIVDKAAQRTDKSKAIVIWSRTLELIDRIGCTDRFLSTGYKVAAANISSGKDQLARITLSGVASPYPFALMIPQSETERLLEGHLNSLGVHVERSVELTRFTGSKSVLSTLHHADGSRDGEETMESSWLIGCDGAHSTVRRGLGMQFAGSTLPSNWILGDVHLSGVPTPNEIMAIWHAHGVLALFPITATRYRVIADVSILVGDTQPADPTLQDVQTVLDERGPGGIHAADPIWLAGFHINERKVAEYRAGRVFLAGDAAHIHSPAGGQGMNTGMQDACNLAWKLALVIRGMGLEEPLLGSYSAERSAVGDEVLKGAGRLTEIGTMKGDIKQSIRNHTFSLIFGFASMRQMAANAASEVSIGYPHSPLNGHGKHHAGEPHEGGRAPIQKDEPPVGAGDTPRFALFSEQRNEKATLLKRYANLLEPKIRKPFAEGGLWLVRPDGYTALTTKQDCWEDVATYLDRITSGSA